MAISYTALKTELLTDPQALGYAALGLNHVAIAALLNDTTKGGTLNLPSADTDQIRAQIVQSEYSALTAQQQAYLNFLLGGNNLYLTTNVKTWFMGLGAGFATSRAAAATLFTRPQSRAEALFGMGTVIQYGDIPIALAS